MTYPGKILLLGEYTVLLGSSALAIPSSTYKGVWNENQPVNKILIPFIQFLRENKFPFLIENFSISDIPYFECNIPIGYGLGSSGSITAAVYDRLCKAKPHSIDILKDQLSQMEAFFHGKSSGIDPLVSFLKKPILIQKNRLSCIDQTIPTSSIQLIDSGQARSTKPWVQLFKEKIKSKSFSSAIENDWIPTVQKTINQLLKNDPEYVRSWKYLSEFQLKHMHEMIPEHIREIWTEGLARDSQYLKLCGAGGGGMFLSLRSKNTD